MNSGGAHAVHPIVQSEWSMFTREIEREVIPGEFGATAVPIPGTRKCSRLEENLAAASCHPGQDTMCALEPLAAAVQGVAI